MRFFAFSIVCLAACSEKAPAPKAAPAAAQGATTLAGHSAMAVGAPVPAGEPTSLAAVLASPDTYAGKTIIVEGKVKAACTKRGCWMEITPLKEGAPACRVRFKDYGFFVPTDSPGAEARLQGEVALRTLAAADVAHLEGEGATLKKEADGSAKTIEIVATGVELMRL